MSKKKNKAVEKTNQAKLLSMHMAYPLSKMKLYKKNPRNHEDTIDLLVRSLGIFGAIAPIVLREDGTIAAGHARYKASKKQGRKTFPAIKVKFVDEEAFIAYVMTDNQIATRSTWISAEFGELHDQLDAAGWVPEDTGFDPDMIPAIRLTPDDLSEDFTLPDGPKSQFEQMTFTLHSRQAKAVRKAIKAAIDSGPFRKTGNENSNGNALTRICGAYNGKS